jgi:membrane-bound metal-dependent hydrolase YbcI (DUF457 family)
VVAAYRGRKQPLPAVALEAAGGALFGHLGSMMPDILEPATTPRHRKVCHSYGAVAGAVTFVDELVTAWEKGCRANAATEWQKFRSQGFTLEGLWHLLLMALSHVAAGALSGFVAGYGVHLLQDAGTPRGLPLLLA